jgi:curved DNA-binding protein CbpA
VTEESFVDYYELLQLSVNADDDTIRRVFRHLAKRHHPDAPGGGDRKQFDRLVEAHSTLTDPQARAAYDAKYQRYWSQTWKVASEAADGGTLFDDANMRDRMLTLFYVKRRQSMRQPGIGELELARLVGVPVEHVEFHIWYLREKGWIQRLETGMLALTAAGVDQIEKLQQGNGTRRLTDGREIKAESN